MENNEFLYGSICLTDIPKNLIRKSDKNGKQYINIGISQLREKSKYGDTHLITVNIPKEQRQPNERLPIIGNLKKWNGSNSNQQSSNVPPEDDLPF